MWYREADGEVVPASAGEVSALWKPGAGVVARTSYDDWVLSTVFLWQNYGTEEHPLFYETAVKYADGHYAPLGQAMTRDGAQVMHTHWLGVLQSCLGGLIMAAAVSNDSPPTDAASIVKYAYPFDTREEASAVALVLREDWPDLRITSVRVAESGYALHIVGPGNVVSAFSAVVPGIAKAVRDRPAIKEP